MEEIKNRIIVELYNNPAFLNKLKSIAKDDYEDLRSDVVEILLNKNVEYIITRHENNTLYATALIIARNLNKQLIVSRQRRVSNVQHNKRGEEFDVIEGLTYVKDEKDIFFYRSEVFSEGFNELPFFSRFILDELLLLGSAKKVSEENRFSYSGVLRALQVAKRQLQEIIKSKTNNIELDDNPHEASNKYYQFKNTLNILNRIESLHS